MPTKLDEEDAADRDLLRDLQLRGNRLAAMRMIVPMPSL